MGEISSKKFVSPMTNRGDSMINLAGIFEPQVTYFGVMRSVNSILYPLFNFNVKK